MVNHRNDLARPEAGDILKQLSLEQQVDENYKPFGDGFAAEKIVSALEGVTQNK